ncbi:tyrosine-type recombinase/integrase [Mycetocola reblochoni]|uniref:tyrosine-type recombinase/integrase n=1 Tax=Mycetocola reblochoni TaxID=331618 RepID=UPI003F96DEFF
MASITAYETAAGKRYRVRYRTPDHKQTDKRGFKTKRDAERFLHDVEGAKNNGTFIEATASSAKINTLGSAWLAGKRTALKPSAFRPLESGWRLRVEPRWGNWTVSRVRHSDVQTWVTELSEQLSATSVLRDYGILAGILDTAVLDRRIPSNPSRGVALPRKTKKQHRYLSHDEALSLALHAGDRRPLILTLAYTGLRWGEAAGLRVRDVDLAKRRLNIVQNAVEVGAFIEVGTPKTHKRRTVPFPAFIASELSPLVVGRPLDALVFGRADGSHMRRARNTASGFGWFARALADAGLETMTIHDLRHTAASLAVSSGANVKAVQRMLGHASAAMTLDTYADLFDDDLNAVADALNHQAMISSVGKTWANAPTGNDKTP